MGINEETVYVQSLHNLIYSDCDFFKYFFSEVDHFCAGRKQAILTMCLSAIACVG